MPLSPQLEHVGHPRSLPPPDPALPSILRSRSACVAPQRDHCSPFKLRARIYRCQNAAPWYSALRPLMMPMESGRAGVQKWAMSACFRDLRCTAFLNGPTDFSEQACALGRHDMFATIIMQHARTTPPSQRIAQMGRITVHGQSKPEREDSVGAGGGAARSVDDE